MYNIIFISFLGIFYVYSVFFKFSLAKVKMLSLLLYPALLLLLEMSLHCCGYNELSLNDINTH